MNTPQKRISNDDKLAMLTLREEGHSVRSIARILNFDPGTISRQLRKAGADTDRSQTAEATAARMAIINAKRLALAEALIEDAESMRERVWDKYQLVANSPAGPVTVNLDEPPLKEQSDGMKAVNVTIDTIDRLLDGAHIETKDNAKNVLTDLVHGLAKFITHDVGLTIDDRDHDYDITTDPDEQPDPQGGTDTQ